jgi:DNA-binding NarL/FixJ family response regulator
MIEEVQPDVAIMDVDMPGMDGVEATRRINHAHPEIKVLAFTSERDESKMEEMHEAGAAAYVLKPATDRLLFELGACASLLILSGR